MKKPWRLHPKTERDIDEAFDWYEAKRPGLGIEFAREVRARIAELQRMPSLGVLVHAEGEEFRRVFVRRFPYWILFVELDDATWSSPSRIVDKATSTGVPARRRRRGGCDDSDMFVTQRCSPRDAVLSGWARVRSAGAPGEET